MIPTFLILAAAASPAQSSSEDPRPKANFESAIEAYEFGEHTRAAELLESVLEPMRLTHREDLIVARQYLGACYHLLGRQADAKRQFAMLLALDASHRLDPQVFSPALVALFEEVRVEAGLGLEPTARRETHPGGPKSTMGNGVFATKDEGSGPGPELGRAAERAASPGATPRSPGAGAHGLVLETPPPEPPPLALAFVPFGVGQFSNRHPVRGTIFAAVEVGLFATAAVGFLLFEDLKTRGPGGQDVFLPKDASAAESRQNLYLVTFWTGIGVAVAGIVEALISHPGDAPEDRRL